MIPGFIGVREVLSNFEFFVDKRVLELDGQCIKNED